jgi:DJ-1/PfpI family
MKFLIFIPPKDFRDESLSLIRLFFDKWGVPYDITSYTAGECTGIHGAIVHPNFHASHIQTQNYNGIVLIDGKGIDDYKLQDYRPLLDILYMFNMSGKYILTVANAAKVPARANIVKDRKVATEDPESKRLVNLFHGVLSSEDFEIAGNLISIKDPNGIEDSMIKILEYMGVS